MATGIINSRVLPENGPEPARHPAGRGKTAVGCFDTPKKIRIFQWLAIGSLRVQRMMPGYNHFLMVCLGVFHQAVEPAIKYFLNRKIIGLLLFKCRDDETVGIRKNNPERAVCQINEIRARIPVLWKKCSFRMLDTECESASTGVSPPIGVTWREPKPGAVAPIRTILSAYLVAGIFPLMTSKNESTGIAGLSLMAL